MVDCKMYMELNPSPSSLCPLQQVAFGLGLYHSNKLGQIITVYIEKLTRDSAPHSRLCTEGTVLICLVSEPRKFPGTELPGLARDLYTHAATDNGGDRPRTLIPESEA